MKCSLGRGLGLLGALLAAVVSSLPAAAQEPPIPVDPAYTDDANLRYQFSEGDRHTYRTEIEQRMTMSGEALLGESAETVMHLVLDAAQTVTGVGENGSATVDQRVSGATVSVNANGQSIPADDLARQLNGIRMTFRMSPRGEIEEVALDEVGDGQVAEMMALVERSMRRNTIEFPEEAVAVGESWSQEIPVQVDQAGMAMETAVTATYTLMGYARHDDQLCAVVRSDIRIRASGSFRDLGLSSTAEGTGTGVGFTYFDVEAGRLVQSSMEIAIDTTVTTEGMSLDQGITATMQVTRM